MSKLLSICIPTYKRPEVLKETLESIYSQDVDNEKFNICITDNSSTDETKDMLDEYFPNVSNLKYKKTTCEGFMNSIEALKFGDGKLLKLHNDYCAFNNGSLNIMINNIELCCSKHSNSIIFFYNDERLIKNKKFIKCSDFYNKDIKIAKCNNFNDFLSLVNYISTWSSAFSIWKDDMDRLYKKNIIVDKQFPHTSYLFNLNDKNEYYIDATNYTYNLSVPFKTDRNVTEHFVFIYLRMVKKLEIDKHITNASYKKICKKILIFCASYKVKTHFEKISYFHFENSNKMILDLLGIKGVLIYNFDILKSVIYRIVKKIWTNILN